MLIQVDETVTVEDDKRSQRFLEQDLVFPCMREKNQESAQANEHRVPRESFPGRGREFRGRVVRTPYKQKGKCWHEYNRQRNRGDDCQAGKQSGQSSGGPAGADLTSPI